MILGMYFGLSMLPAALVRNLSILQLLLFTSKMYFLCFRVPGLRIGMNPIAESFVIDVSCYKLLYAVVIVRCIKSSIILRSQN